MILLQQVIGMQESTISLQLFFVIFSSIGGGIVAFTTVKITTFQHGKDIEMLKATKADSSFVNSEIQKRNETFSKLTESVNKLTESVNKLTIEQAGFDIDIKYIKSDISDIKSDIKKLLQK